MNIEEYREYCLSIKGATESFPFGENTLVYKIMDKMFTFAPLNPKEGRFWADTKCDPTKSTELMALHSVRFPTRNTGLPSIWRAMYRIV